MTDLEKDLRAASYHLGAAANYLGKAGRTKAADACTDEIGGIDVQLDLMRAAVVDEIKRRADYKAEQEFFNQG